MKGMVGILYSLHWARKKKYRTTITEADIEYSITHSMIIPDKRWNDVLNAICRIPPSGRILKVVYKRKGKFYKILTAYWLD
jgi:hypothetical protein